MSNIEQLIEWKMETTPGQPREHAVAWVKLAIKMAIRLAQPGDIEELVAGVILEEKAAFATGG
jgi:hypothetical protein